MAIEAITRRAVVDGLSDVDGERIEFVQLHARLVGLAVRSSLHRDPGEWDWGELSYLCLSWRLAFAVARGGPRLAAFLWVSSPCMRLVREEAVRLRLASHLDGVFRQIEQYDDRMRHHLGGAPKIGPGVDFIAMTGQRAMLDAYALSLVEAWSAPGVPRSTRDWLLGIFREQVYHVTEDASPGDVAVPGIGLPDLALEIRNGEPYTRLSPDLIEAGARRAFATGDLMTARQLLQLGLRWHADDAALSQLWALLRPPETGATLATARSESWASHAWLDRFGSHYRGEWVVVFNGELRGSDRSLVDLRARLGSFEPGSLVFRVPE